MLTSDRLDGLDNLLALRVGGLDEDVSEGETGLGVGGEVVGRDLVEKGNRVLLGEDEERVVVDLTLEVVAALVEGLVEDDSGDLDVGSSGGGGVGRDTEEVVVAVEVGKVGEGGLDGRVGLVDVSDEDDLVGGAELVVVLGGDVGNGGKCLPVGENVSEEHETRREQRKAHFFK